MKSRVLLSLFIMLLILASIGCSGIITPSKILSANIIITEWEQEGPGTAPQATFTITGMEQTYYEYIEEWSTYADIYYEVENIGTVEIDSYKVWFTVTCIDGNKYYDWTNGLSVGVGCKYSDWTMVNVAGKQVVSVIITDWELTSWGF